eukprot:s102_g18.t2
MISKCPSLPVGVDRPSKDPDAIAEAKRRFEGFMAGDSSVLPDDIKEPVFKMVLKAGGKKDPEYSELRALHEKAETNIERKHVYVTIGCASDMALKKDVLEWVVSGEIKIQDFFYPLGSVASSSKEADAGYSTRHAPATFTWEFYKSNFDKIVSMLKSANPSLMDAMISLSARGFSTAEGAAEVEQFYKDHPLKQNQRTISQTLAPRTDWGSALLPFQKKVASTVPIPAAVQSFEGLPLVTLVDLEDGMNHMGNEWISGYKSWCPTIEKGLFANLLRRTLAQNVMNGIGEKRFKTMLPKSFPELAYFGSSHAKQHDQTYGALLSVYWLVNDQHDAFTREQDQNDVLSKQSWAWIQDGLLRRGGGAFFRGRALKDWMSEHLRLQFEEVLDSTMVFMAIHALGKINQFREERWATSAMRIWKDGYGSKLCCKEVAPKYANSPELHDVALASILEETPEIVPSFNRLSAKYKSLIIDSLCVDFQFSQFLQAEIVPSNLVVVKEKLQQHGEEGYSLFCFRIFAQMSGKLGDKSLHGSLFMTESQFQKFRPGLEALMQLRSRFVWGWNMDAGPAYNAFLLLRGSKALSRFASWQHQALVRLLCLSTAYDRDSGDAVCNAFDKLSNAERASLTRWLVADGISQRPGEAMFGEVAFAPGRKCGQIIP